jgi:hypothetical protein
VKSGLRVRVIAIVIGVAGFWLARYLPGHDAPLIVGSQLVLLPISVVIAIDGATVGRDRRAMRGRRNALVAIACVFLVLSAVGSFCLTPGGFMFLAFGELTLANAIACHRSIALGLQEQS